MAYSRFVGQIMAELQRYRLGISMFADYLGVSDNFFDFPLDTRTSSATMS
jgi:hypothetical protein